MEKTINIDFYDSSLIFVTHTPLETQEEGQLHVTLLVRLFDLLAPQQSHVLPKTSWVDSKLGNPDLTVKVNAYSVHNVSSRTFRAVKNRVVNRF